MKKRTIIIGMFILFLVGVISIIGTYAIDSTITEGNSSTADYLFNITLGDRTNREVVIPSYDSKIVDIKISNPNEFNMSYLLYIEGVNSNISVINIKDTEASGVLASKTVTIIQVFIQNNSSSDVTIKIKDKVGFEKETLTLPDNSTGINKGNYYKAIVKSNNNTYGKVKPNIKLSTLNGTVKYEIVPNTGYKYKSTTCTGSITDNILTISNITSNINCEVVFEPIEVSVSFDTDGGEISTTYTETKEHTYTVPYSGTYKLEVWGAQGGNASEYKGGYGGYSRGHIYLTSGTTLYINVGGSGKTASSSSTFTVGGYNGGGSANYSAGTGGGATHIAIVDGLLSSLSENIDDILIVAGGGGGAGVFNSTTIGGSGGGTSGVAGGDNSASFPGGGGGGTQTSGGTLGKGSVAGVVGSFGSGGRGGYESSFSDGSGAGGGGYYGGAGGSARNGGGGGGSGYIGNTQLTNKYMYCYNCSTSDDEATKTYTTTNVSSTPTANYAKSGAGAARITLIDNASYTVSYGQNYGTLPIPTKEGYVFAGWYTEPNGQGTKITEDTVLTIATNHTLYAYWPPLINVSFDGNMFVTSSNSITSNGLTITYDPISSYLTINGTPTASSILNNVSGLTFTVGDEYITKLTHISGNATNAGSGGGKLVVDVEKKSGTNVSTRNYSDTALENEDTNSTLAVNSAAASEGTGFKYWLWFATPADWKFTNYVVKVDVTKIENKEITLGSKYGTMSTPKRRGYNFSGWYTGENGTGTKITSESIVSTASDHTLYAYWTTPSKYTTSGSHTFTAHKSGLYKIELWGAQGGGISSSPGGYGGYVSGSVFLQQNDNLYIYVGENYNGYKNSFSFNGGGRGSYSSSADNYNGGGATDVRYFGTYQPTEDDLAWDSTIGLNSRIMVAAGGGGYTNWGSDSKGGNAGGLIGGSGNRDGSIVVSTGGTQTSGGNGTDNTSTTPMVGVFGAGGYGSTYTGTWIYNAGGGGGYYGGGAGGAISGSVGSAAGGSSYISGHTGCVAITSSSSRDPRTGSDGASCTTGTSDNLCSIHYSDKKFLDTVMIDGSGYAWTNTKGSLQQMPNPSGGYYSSGIGRSGSGVAIITFLGEDAGPPIGTLTANKDYNNINVSINATDDMGIDHYEYYLGTSSTCPTEGYTISNNNTYIYDITSTGTYYVCVRVVDKVGNILSLVSQPIDYSRIYSVTVRYNTNGGTITPNTSSYTWTTDDTGLIYQNGNIYEQVIRHGTPADLANYNNSEFINITPTDDLNVVSGSEWICLSGCSESNKLYSQTTKYNASDFCDVTDNNCTVVLGLNLVGDATPPTCTLSANSSTITASASDSGGSGLAYNGWSSSYSGSNSTSKSIATGTHTYYVKDGAGNTGSCSITIAGTTTNYKKTTKTCKVTSVGCSKAATASASGSCTCRTATSATYTGTCSVSGGTASCSCSSPVTNTCSVSYSCSSGVRQGSYCYLGEQSSCPSGWGTYKYNYGFTSSTSSVTSCSVGSSFTCDSSHSGSTYVSACTVSSYTCPSGYTKINNSYCYK